MTLNVEKVGLKLALNGDIKTIYTYVPPIRKYSGLKMNFFRKNKNWHILWHYISITVDSTKIVHTFVFAVKPTLVDDTKLIPL